MEFPELGGEGGDQNLDAEEIQEIPSGIDSLAKSRGVIKGTIGTLDPDATYRGIESGVEYTGEQLGYIGWKGEQDVEVDDEGVRVDGELFEPDDDAENKSDSPGSESEGSVTSDTGGVHSARYSPEGSDDEEFSDEAAGLTGPKDADKSRPVVYDLGKETAECGGQWVSFVGPEGGECWVNLDTGEKRY